MTVSRLGSYPTYPVRDQFLSGEYRSGSDLTVLDTVSVSTRRYGFKVGIVITANYAGEGVRLETYIYKRRGYSDLPPQDHERVVEGVQYEALAK